MDIHGIFKFTVEKWEIYKLEWSELRCSNEDCVWIRKTRLYCLHGQFYSSPTLFKELVKHGFGAVGTEDTTRKGCPFVLTAQKKKMMKTAYNRVYGVWIRDGPIVYSLWKDTKVVCEASTIHTGNSDHTVKRHIKNGGGCEEVIVPISNSIYDYNKQMGGVDLSDNKWEGLTSLITNGWG